MVKSKNKIVKLTLSVLALIEVLLLTAGVTFSWMEGGKRSKIEESGIMISASSNLIMYQDGTITNEIILDPCSLEETSSADGRNFFFPMTDNSSDATQLMFFREGIPGDRNEKYISADFELMAGDSSANVYLGAGTIIECNNENVLNALRMSFSLNDGSDPIVFKPTQLPGIEEAVYFEPIVSINNTQKELVSNKGNATTAKQTTKSYGDFYYVGDNSTPLFTIEAQQKKYITLSIWLEGTLFEPTDTVASEDLKIYIDFTTSVDDLKRYDFVDNTRSVSENEGPVLQYWTTRTDEVIEGGQKYQTMLFLYDKDQNRYYAMTKSSSYDTDHTWSVYVPDTIVNFSFRRYCIDINTWWNEWVPDMTIPNGVSGIPTYIAICGKADSSTGTERTPCGGFWQDEYGTIRIFFKDTSFSDGSPNAMGTTVNCFLSGSKSSTLSTWPGKTMTFSHTEDDGNGNMQRVYYLDLNMEQYKDATLAVFNNGNSGYGNQTGDINLSTYGGLFNSFAAWYNGESTGTYIYRNDTDNLIY